MTVVDNRPRWQSLVGCALLMLLAGCASPTSELRALAASQGFERSRVTIDGFRHTVFWNRRPTRDGVLHVYLEGDGSPWSHRTLVMADPTPRRPLMLGLMGEDRQATVYVGRPCYNGTFTQPGCNNRLWTSERYSPVVVASMTGVVRQEIERRGASRIRLFGYSGGGALALLIAERLPRTVDVITVAGNLDIDAWTRFHRYTPLLGSLNPAERDPLPEHVQEWHLLAERDAVIPPRLVGEFLAKRPEASVRVFRGYSHGCCWDRVWPAVLQAVVDGRPDALPGRKPEGIRAEDFRPVAAIRPAERPDRR